MEQGGFFVDWVDADYLLLGFVVFGIVLVVVGVVVLVVAPIVEGNTIHYTRRDRGEGEESKRRVERLCFVRFSARGRGPKHLIVLYLLILRRSANGVIGSTVHLVPLI